jgi:hypothetical protein
MVNPFHQVVRLFSSKVDSTTLVQTKERSVDKRSQRSRPSQSSRSSSRGPNSNINNNLDNSLQRCSLTQSQWRTRSCFPSCSWRTLSKIESLLECLMSCRLGINLTSHVPFIKGHPAMTSSTVYLWRLKSRSWLKPIWCSLKVEFGWAN